MGAGEGEEAEVGACVWEGEEKRGSSGLGVGEGLRGGGIGG